MPKPPAAQLPQPDSARVPVIELPPSFTQPGRDGTDRVLLGKALWAQVWVASIQPLCASMLGTGGPFLQTVGTSCLEVWVALKSWESPGARASSCGGPMLSACSLGAEGC